MDCLKQQVEAQTREKDKLMDMLSKCQLKLEQTVSSEFPVPLPVVGIMLCLVLAGAAAVLSERVQKERNTAVIS